MARCGATALLTLLLAVAHRSALGAQAAQSGGQGGAGHASVRSTAAVDASGGMRAATRELPPRLFFLFLANTGVERPDLWHEFFLGAPPGSYRALLHCRSAGQCDLDHSLPFKPIQVQTVRTIYCRDLVSAMVQLLAEATRLSFSSRDKFIFVSESTLPVKPFKVVYDTLTRDENSDFCITPDDHWLALQSGEMRSMLLAHSQWVTLSKDHALQMVRQWPIVRGNGTGFEVSLSGYPADRRVLPKDVPMCTDEWAVFGTIYGLIEDKGKEVISNLPGFGGPLYLHGVNASSSFQGACHTFASWGHHSFPSEKSKLITALSKDWPHTEISCRGLHWDGKHLLTSVPRLPCNDTHPAEITQLSDRGAQILRQSHFLFVRKFSPKVMDVSQFRRLILDRGPR